MNLKLKSLKNVNELLLNYQHLQTLHFSDIKAFGGINKEGRYRSQHDLKLLRLDWISELMEFSFTSFTPQLDFNICDLTLPKSYKLRKITVNIPGEY